MKRFATAILAFLLVFSLLAGCAGRPADEEPTVPTTQTPEAPAPLDDTPPIYTMEEAALNNAEISDADISLLQFEASSAAATHKALITTNMGDLEMLLFGVQAPNAVKSFVIHAQEGYYNGLTFNKILNNFLVEGGDPTGNGGESALLDAAGKNKPFANEYSLDLWHFRGAVSMSRLPGQTGNGSRFFIVQAPFVDEETLAEMEKANFPDKVLRQYEAVGGTPGFDWKRTVFGMLTADSLKALDIIALSTVDDKGVPKDSVLIENITITELPGAKNIPAATEPAK